MILEGAIGDAYGAGFEFANRSKIIKKNTLTQYEAHPKYTSIYKKYTDDTQMAIAISELLLSEAVWTENLVAEQFLAVFKRDPREGYSKRMYKVLSETNTAVEFFARSVFKSDRNGAAMRAYPLGLIKDEGELLNKAYIQAKVTHDTEKAIQSAQAVALMLHYFRYKKGKQEHLVAYLSDTQNYDWKGVWTQEVSTDCLETVEAILTILSQKKELSAMLTASVAFGGDVDTVASVSLAIASQISSVAQNLPDWLTTDLENETYGRAYIQSLDEQLMRKFGF